MGIGISRRHRVGFDDDEEAEDFDSVSWVGLGGTTATTTTTGFMHLLYIPLSTHHRIRL